jgi:ATP-grasp domain, R2K clade family 3
MSWYRSRLRRIKAMKMSDVKWLLEPEAFPNERYPLIEALGESGRKHVVCKLGHPYETYTRKFSKDDLVMFHGSKQFAEIIRKETNWKVYWNTPQFECKYYYPIFSKHLINQEYVMLPCADLINKKEWLFKNLGEQDALFLKSDEFKVFSGKVVREKEWDHEIKQIRLWADPETMVVIAKPSTITTEWRMIVANGKVIAQSSYKPVRGFICDEVTQYAEKVLRSVQFAPDPIWILDIGVLVDDTYKVLEVGPFSCCSFYECDVDAIIDAVENNING